MLIGCHSEHTHEGHEQEAHEHGENTESVTIWTDTVEAFVEYDQLTPNEPSRMLIHLTWLDGHRPVTEIRSRHHTLNKMPLTIRN